MPTKLVRVQIANNGLPCRIFRNKDWKLLSEEEVGWMTKAEAVKSIREQVYERSVGIYGGQCERCGRRLTPQTMEMNERRPKGAGGGKTGGEVSLENCEALCHQCHQGSPDSAHGNRRWQTSKLTSDEGPNGN
jgi:5-methylcytosine-specific restriction endonuclease McrA